MDISAGPLQQKKDIEESYNSKTFFDLKRKYSEYNFLETEEEKYDSMLVIQKDLFFQVVAFSYKKWVEKGVRVYQKETIEWAINQFHERVRNTKINLQEDVIIPLFDTVLLYKDHLADYFSNSFVSSYNVLFFHSGWKLLEDFDKVLLLVDEETEKVVLLPDENDARDLQIFAFLRSLVTFWSKRNAAKAPKQDYLYFKKNILTPKMKEAKQALEKSTIFPYRTKLLEMMDKAIKDANKDNYIDISKLYAYVPAKQNVSHELITFWAFYFLKENLHNGLPKKEREKLFIEYCKEQRDENYANFRLLLNNCMQLELDAGFQTRYLWYSPLFTVIDVMIFRYLAYIHPSAFCINNFKQELMKNATETNALISTIEKLFSELVSRHRDYDLKTQTFEQYKAATGNNSMNISFWFKSNVDEMCKKLTYKLNETIYFEVLHHVQDTMENFTRKDAHPLGMPDYENEINRKIGIILERK